jgi:hypothetical protein
VVDVVGCSFAVLIELVMMELVGVVMILLGLVLAEVSVVDVEEVVISVGVVDLEVRFGIENGVEVASNEYFPVADARFELRSRFSVLAGIIEFEKGKVLWIPPPTKPLMTALIIIRVANTAKAIQNVLFRKL